MAALGKYELVRKLAQGGMAEVFLARVQGPFAFQKELVVKRILPGLSDNEEFVQLFLNEGRLAALLNHANVVQLYDLGQEAGSYYLAMEYVDGPNLRELVRAGTTAGAGLPWPVAVKVLSLACEGLAYAHEFVGPDGTPLRLVHRDISPHNLLVSRAGNVKVADFGIARAATIPSLTKTGKIRGKLKYMSPEQLRDEPLDKRSDVWALGVTLYEALTGARPFESGSEAGVVNAILSATPAPLRELRPGLPELLQPVVERALARDREARYPDCRALQADLERALISGGELVRGLEIAQAVDRLCPRPAEALLAPEVASAPATLLTPIEEGPPPTALTPLEGPAVTAITPLDAPPAFVPTHPDGPLARSGEVRPAVEPAGPAPTVTATNPDTAPSRSRPGLREQVARHPVRAGLAVGTLAVFGGLGLLALLSGEPPRPPPAGPVPLPAGVPRLLPTDESSLRPAAAVPVEAPTLRRDTPPPAQVELAPEPGPASRGGGGGHAGPPVLAGFGKDKLIATRRPTERGGLEELEEAPAPAPSFGRLGSRWQPEPGHLELHVIPPSQVDVDDTDFGVVTDAHLTLEAGEHLVRVWGASGSNRSYKVRISPKQTQVMNLGL